MKKGLILLLLSVSSLLAKAPVWEDAPGNVVKRVPAQIGIPNFDIYLDMNCSQLTNESSKDEFVQFFIRSSKEIHPDICSIVKEEMDTDLDIIQSEKETIGLGTFSHMVEAHFNDFISQKRLSLYQDMNCEELTDEKSNDEFIRYFSRSLKTDGVDLCGNMGSVEMDSDLGQVQMPIGRGTYSKLIETYYDSFLYGQ